MRTETASPAEFREVFILDTRARAITLRRNEPQLDLVCRLRSA
jgi:hypothetical protein